MGIPYVIVSTGLYCNSAILNRCTELQVIAQSGNMHKAVTNREVAVPRQRTDEPTRQLYAQIREDLYLAAKARAAEMRVPLRIFLEKALTNALEGNGAGVDTPSSEPSVWDDEYLSIQRRQPVGSPVELTSTEASAIVLDAVHNRAALNESETAP